VEAHARRTAVLAGELAGRLRLGPGETETLVQAALLHHFPREVLNADSLDRLLADVRAGYPPGSESPVAGDVRLVLERLHAPRCNDTASLLAQIVEAASFFDDRLEFLPFEPVNFTQIVDELDWISRDGFSDPALPAALAGLPQIRVEELAEQVNRLPVFPAVLLRCLEIAAGEDSSFRELERIAGQDQALAGRILQAANSSLYHPLRRIASIPQAISYIGIDACRRVIMAASLQALFGSAAFQELWKHSIVVAQTTERLALDSGCADPHEAFLAGLVHDVGRLALLRLRREHVASYRRLVEGGCEPVFAETLLCGFEHGAAGAEILRRWAFPEHLVDAVRLHHRPEATESPLAAALFVAEECNGSEEDRVSGARRRIARERLGVAGEITEYGAPVSGWLDFLVSAA
jgi:putative nucleotidyltransferase with HDIG domain